MSDDGAAPRNWRRTGGADANRASISPSPGCQVPLRGTRHLHGDRAEIGHHEGRIVLEQFSDFFGMASVPTTGRSSRLPRNTCSGIAPQAARVRLWKQPGSRRSRPESGCHRQPGRSAPSGSRREPSQRLRVPLRAVAQERVHNISQRRISWVHAAAKRAAARSISAAAAWCGIGRAGAEAPDGARPGGVGVEAADHMDVELRHDVADRRHVHLVGLCQVGITLVAMRISSINAFASWSDRSVSSLNAGARGTRTNHGKRESFRSRTERKGEVPDRKSCRPASRGSSVKAESMAAMLVALGTASHHPFPFPQGSAGRSGERPSFRLAFRRSETPYRPREVGEGRLTRQPGQIRKEAALTRPNGSSSSLPPSCSWRRELIP